MPASAEFAALCRSQISFMAEVVGADSTAVYLAESWSTQALPKLVPIAIYPSASPSTPEWSSSEKALPEVSAVKTEPLSVPSGMPSFEAQDAFLDLDSALSDHRRVNKAEKATPQRIAIPMMHEGGVFGVVVGWKADRPWRAQERDRFEECARSLTLACVLDQRGQWLKAQMSSLDHVQTQQSDRFHELLHQLRSPLTALKTFGKLLLKRLPQEDNNQSLVHNMLRESDRMQELLGYFDDTLQAADETREETSSPLPLLAPADEASETVDAQVATDKADSLSHFGGILNIQSYAVADVISPLIELTQTLAEADDMTLHVVPPEQEIYVQVDAKALTEILNNFLDNTLKYSSAKTRMWIQWGLSQPDKPGLSGILVGDTGPGIPEADQAHIFERHYRGIQAAGDLEGSGLGLAIAFDLIREMQGYVELYSPLSTLPWPLPQPIQDVPDMAGTAFVTWLPKD
ncbi:sensor histidine kinase [Oscillatoria sp. CS-180]|uniref:sensor histidine kinase n=1 Tax=Oscillatoria sp. CS-180 TaxID=3021720 RepID=UPI00232DD9E7|nr:HAMP domain-containing sensor histidine kinase [Oscillatoria sp. CS-180]